MNADMTFAEKLALATLSHDDSFARAKAVAGWHLGDEEWASLILAAYAAETGGLYGIAEGRLREALVERLGPEEAARLLPTSAAASPGGAA